MSLKVGDAVISLWRGRSQISPLGDTDTYTDVDGEEISDKFRAEHQGYGSLDGLRGVIVSVAANECFIVEFVDGDRLCFSEQDLKPVHPLEQLALAAVEEESDDDH